MERKSYTAKYHMYVYKYQNIQISCGTRVGSLERTEYAFAISQHKAKTNQLADSFADLGLPKPNPKKSLPSGRVKLICSCAQAK
jgi:hypothetical protein